jgi:hypothetical protein
MKRISCIIDDSLSFRERAYSLDRARAFIFLMQSGHVVSILFFGNLSRSQLDSIRFKQILSPLCFLLYVCTFEDSTDCRSIP